MEQRAQKETQINIYSQVIFDKETKATNAAETASSTNGARTAGHTHINAGPDLTPFTKINSKRVIGLNIKRKTIKLLEDNGGENPDDPGYLYDFLDTKPKA